MVFLSHGRNSPLITSPDAKVSGMTEYVGIATEVVVKAKPPETGIENDY